MSDGLKTIAGGLIIIGLVTLMMMASIGKAKRIELEHREQFEKEAYQHGAGTYDRETGKFIWTTNEKSPNK